MYNFSEWTKDQENSTKSRVFKAGSSYGIWAVFPDFRDVLSIPYHILLLLKSGYILQLMYESVFAFFVFKKCCLKEEGIQYT